MKDGCLSGLKERPAKPPAFAPRGFESHSVRSEQATQTKRGVAPASKSKAALVVRSGLGRAGLAKAAQVLSARAARSPAYDGLSSGVAAGYPKKAKAGTAHVWVLGWCL